MNSNSFNEISGIATAAQLPRQLLMSTSFTPAAIGAPRGGEDNFDRMIGAGAETHYNTRDALAARARKKKKSAVLLMRDLLNADYGMGNSDEWGLHLPDLKRLRRVRRARRARIRDADTKRINDLDEDAKKKRLKAENAEADAEKKRLQAEEAETSAKEARTRADEALEQDQKRLQADADRAQLQADKLTKKADQAQVKADKAKLNADKAQAKVDKARAEIETNQKGKSSAADNTQAKTDTKTPKSASDADSSKRPAGADELRSRFDRVTNTPAGEVPGIKNADFDARSMVGDTGLSSRKFKILDALGGRLGVGGDLVMAGVVGSVAYSVTGSAKTGLRMGSETLPIVGSVMAFQQGRVNEGIVRTAEDVSGLLLTFGGAAAGAGMGAAVGTAVLPIVGTAVGFVVGGVIGFTAGMGASLVVSEAIRGAARLIGLEDVDPTLVETLFGDEVSEMQKLINMRFLVRERETELAAEQRSIIDEMKEELPASEIENIERIVQGKLTEFGSDDVPLEIALRDPRVFFAVYEEYGGRMIDNPDDALAVQTATYLESFLKQEEGRLQNEQALLQLQVAEVQLDADDRQEYQRKYSQQIIAQSVDMLRQSGMTISLEDINPELHKQIEGGQLNADEMLEVTIDALALAQEELTTQQTGLLQTNLSQGLRDTLQAKIEEEFGEDYKTINLAAALQNPEVLRFITDQYGELENDSDADNVLDTLTKFEALEIKKQSFSRSEGLVRTGYDRTIQMQASMGIKDAAEYASDRADNLVKGWRKTMSGDLGQLYSHDERRQMKDDANDAYKEIEELYESGSFMLAIERSNVLTKSLRNNLEDQTTRILESKWDELNLDQFSTPPKNAQELSALLRNQQTRNTFVENQRDTWSFESDARDLLDKVQSAYSDIEEFETAMSTKAGSAVSYMQAGQVATIEPPRPS